MQKITSEIIGMWKEEHRNRYQQNARVLLTLKTKKPGARKNGKISNNSLKVNILINNVFLCNEVGRKIYQDEFSFISKIANLT